MTNYKEIPMNEFENRDREIVEAVIHEGEMRQGEKVIALLERKITEAYACLLYTSPSPRDS